MKTLAAALFWTFCAISAQAAERVTVGAYLNDIHDLDLKTHSYSVDIYVWLRWRDPKLDPAATLEFNNPYELWGHARALEHEKPVRLPTGELYQVLRVQGRFSRKFKLGDYPFDHQTLLVDFEDARATSDDLVYIPAELEVSPELELPGFDIGKPRFFAADTVYPTDFGDLRKPGTRTFSRVRLEIPISRPALTYSIKLLLPILSVLFCAALMFLFHPKHLDARVGIGITALLTIVALQITLNGDLPEVAYLVLMDKIYLGAYLFVIAGLAVIVRTTWMVERGREKEAMAMDRRMLAVLSAAYLAAAAWILSTAGRG
ncbi:MAG: hypothetical protein AAB320_08435 [Elusimicrobiota bacterium]